MSTQKQESEKAPSLVVESSCSFPGRGLALFELEGRARQERLNQVRAGTDPANTTSNSCAQMKKGGIMLNVHISFILCTWVHYYLPM